MALVLVTGAAALALEGSLLRDSFGSGLILLALFLTGGSANAFNQYFERDLDAQMERTRNRRPLPLGVLAPKSALTFAITIGVAGVTVFLALFNLLAALLATGTILFYGFFYTLLLKPRTHWNIVIGGAAGAMAPPIAWAATANNVAPAAWLMALIIFLWTPPHFWALALFRRSDYETVALPMLPVVKGDLATLNAIVGHTVVVVLVSITLSFLGAGWIYLAAAIGLGAWFIVQAELARRQKSEATQRRLFGYSIVYLMTLFSSVIVEGII